MPPGQTEDCLFWRFLFFANPSNEGWQEACIEVYYTKPYMLYACSGGGEEVQWQTRQEMQETEENCDIQR